MTNTLYVNMYTDCCKTGKINVINTKDMLNFTCLFGCDIMDILWHFYYEIWK